MAEFITKSGSRGDKMALVNSKRMYKINQFTLISYGVGVRCDTLIFSVHSPFIEVYV